MLMVVHDGSLPFTKRFRSACCTKFRFLSSLAYLLQPRKKPFDFGAAGLEGGEEPSGGIVLRLIQDPGIPASSSRNAVSLPFDRTTKRFPSPAMRVSNPDRSP